MTEPGWKTELRWMAEAFAATSFEGHPAPSREVQGVMSRYLLGAAMPHIEAAYKRGHEAGSSQAGHRLVRENERLRRELEQARKGLA